MARPLFRWGPCCPAPLFAGAMLDRSSFGWPLLCGGVAKAIYDVLLLVQFRAVEPPDESGPTSAGPDRTLDPRSSS